MNLLTDEREREREREREEKEKRKQLKVADCVGNFVSTSGDLHGIGISEEEETEKLFSFFFQERTSYTILTLFSKFHSSFLQDSIHLYCLCRSIINPSVNNTRGPPFLNVDFLAHQIMLVNNHWV
jgi:hypothetical protein